MNAFENDPSKDDQVVEITDLHPVERTSRLSSILVALEKRPSLRKRFWRIAITSSTILLILLVLFSTFSSLRVLGLRFFSRSVPTPSNTFVIPMTTPYDSYGFIPNEQIVWSLASSSSFIPSATLDHPPRVCPEVSQTHPFEYKGAPLVAGNSPVLVIGFGGPDAVLTNFKHAQPPEIGWYRRIFMLAQTNYTGKVTFHGGSLSDGTPIWFGMKQHNQGPLTTFTLLPLDTSVSNHTGTDEEWRLSAATLYIPRADCYFLKATWPEGSWVVFFAAGR